MIIHPSFTTDEDRSGSAIDRARRLVSLTVQVASARDREVAEAVAQHIASTGDCVVHAVYVVTNAKACWCAKCIKTA